MKKPEIQEINILYIEDNITNFDGVKNLLSKYKEYKFRLATDLTLAENELQARKFNMILLDLGLPPDPNDLEPSIKFMQKLKLNHPEIIIIIFSAISNMNLPYVKAALHSGISYIVKEDIKKGEDLHRIFSLSREGCVIYTQAPTSTFGEIFQDAKPKLFTAREAQVASLVHEGLTNKQIAERLHIAEFTARDLVTKVYQKSDTGSRAEFAVWYERHKMKIT